MATSFLASSILPELRPIRGQKLTFETYGKTLAPPLNSRLTVAECRRNVLMRTVSLAVGHSFETFMLLSFIAGYSTYFGIVISQRAWRRTCCGEVAVVQGGPKNWHHFCTP